MPYIPPEIVAKAKEMDLLTYLRTYEPQEQVRVSSNTYCTQEHDSLKLSNGKWYWFSRGFGGKSALDYLVKVRQMPFAEAVETIIGKSELLPPVIETTSKKPQSRKLKLPEASPSANHAVRYLTGRGIDSDLIRLCIDTGRLYESLPYHNVVFIGQDKFGKARYAHLRSTSTDFKGEASGSDKRFSFHIPATGSDTVHLFESAIDLLSYATLQKLDGNDWRSDHLLSLAGVYRPQKDNPHSSIPLALTQYLKDYPGIGRIVLRLDNDFAGRAAAQALQSTLSEKYEVLSIPPPQGKDYNDCLCLRKGIPIARPRSRPKER